MSGSVRTPRPILLEVTPTSHQQLAAASRRTVLVDGAERFNATEPLRALLGFLCHGGQRCAIEWLPADAGVTEQRRAFSRAAVALTTLERADRLAWMRPPSVAALLVPSVAPAPQAATGHRTLDHSPGVAPRGAYGAASSYGPPGSSGDVKQLSPSSSVHVWWHAVHRSYTGADGVLDLHGVDLQHGWSDFRSFARWLFRLVA